MDKRTIEKNIPLLEKIMDKFTEIGMRCFAVRLIDLYFAFIDNNYSPNDNPFAFRDSQGKRLKLNTIAYDNRFYEFYLLEINYLDILGKEKEKRKLLEKLFLQLGAETTPEEFPHLLVYYYPFFNQEQLTDILTDVRLTIEEYQITENNITPFKYFLVQQLRGLFLLIRIKNKVSTNVKKTIYAVLDRLTEVLTEVLSSKDQKNLIDNERTSADYDQLIKESFDILLFGYEDRPIIPAKEIITFCSEIIPTLPVEDLLTKKIVYFKLMRAIAIGKKEKVTLKEPLDLTTVINQLDNYIDDDLLTTLLRYYHDSKQIDKEKKLVATLYKTLDNQLERLINKLVTTKEHYFTNFYLANNDIFQPEDYTITSILTVLLRYERTMDNNKGIRQLYTKIFENGILSEYIEYLPFIRPLINLLSEWIEAEPSVNITKPLNLLNNQLKRLMTDLADGIFQLKEESVENGMINERDFIMVNLQSLINALLVSNYLYPTIRLYGKLVYYQPKKSSSHINTILELIALYDSYKEWMTKDFPSNIDNIAFYYYHLIKCLVRGYLKKHNLINWLIPNIEDEITYFTRERLEKDPQIIADKKYKLRRVIFGVKGIKSLNRRLIIPGLTEKTTTKRKKSINKQQTKTFKIRKR